MSHLLTASISNFAVFCHDRTITPLGNQIVEQLSRVLAHIIGRENGAPNNVALRELDLARREQNLDTQVHQAIVRTSKAVTGETQEGEWEREIRVIFKRGDITVREDVFVEGQPASEIVEALTHYIKFRRVTATILTNNRELAATLAAREKRVAAIDEEISLGLLTNQAGKPGSDALEDKERTIVVTTESMPSSSEEEEQEEEEEGEEAGESDGDARRPATRKKRGRSTTSEGGKGPGREQERRRKRTKVTVEYERLRVKRHHVESTDDTDEDDGSVEDEDEDATDAYSDENSSSDSSEDDGSYEEASQRKRRRGVWGGGYAKGGQTKRTPARSQQQQQQQSQVAEGGRSERVQESAEEKKRRRGILRRMLLSRSKERFQQQQQQQQQQDIQQQQQQQQEEEGTTKTFTMTPSASTSAIPQDVIPIPKSSGSASSTGDLPIPVRRPISSEILSGAAKVRPNHPPEQKKMLKDWFEQHRSEPYPTQEEKIQLSQETGLTLIQINDWFINARRRY